MPDFVETARKEIDEQLRALKDEAARLRFQNRRAEIAAKRGVLVEQLPRTATWVDNIELDEERM